MDDCHRWPAILHQPGRRKIPLMFQGPAVPLPSNQDWSAPVFHPPPPTPQVLHLAQPQHAGALALFPPDRSTCGPASTEAAV